MHRTTIAAALACTAVAVGTTAGASASMMHPTLGAKLAGMGHSGVVNLTASTTKGSLCWSFELPASGLTSASIRDGAGMTVVKLGSMYQAKGCAMVSTMTLDQLESKPGSYRVWVDTHAMAGDIRGTLFAGMAHASHM
jgi:hypothetical protein